MLTQLYRLLPLNFRDKIYRAFLGEFLLKSRERKLLSQNQNRKCYLALKKYLYGFDHKQGIEIGGPSFIFSKKLGIPVYALSLGVDGCNYSSHTVWEGEIRDTHYRYRKWLLGTQYIGEATAVSAVVKDKKYDFVISSNCLEHVANPVKAVKDWMNVLKKTGLILLIVPEKESNFDHNRAYTPFEHLVEDYTNGVDEDDMTHFDEIIEKHDLARDTGITDREAFIERSKNNKENRCFHHHVFNRECLVALFDYLQLEVLFTQTTLTDHIILGRKK